MKLGEWLVASFLAVVAIALFIVVDASASSHLWR
jgi:hypothetical protein